MDPLSVIGALAAIVQLSTTVGSYIKTTKDATSDRKKLLSEVNATSSLCQTLVDYVELTDQDDFEPWTATFATLAVPDGPLMQFRKVLLLLEERLTASKLRSKLIKTLTWPFSKPEVLEIMASIERQKLLFNIALSNDALRLSIAIRDDVRGIAQGVATIQLEQEEHMLQTRRLADGIGASQKKSILANLSSIDFESTHLDISSRRVDGTGRWLLETQKFIDWLGASRECLWCRGLPGCGKTILASLVIDTMRNPEGSAFFEIEGNLAHHSSLQSKMNGRRGLAIGVAGIYCSYRSQPTIAAMLGSLVSQLAGKLSILPKSLENIGASPPLKALSSAFADIAMLFDEVIIVVDALDECTIREELLRELRKLLDLNMECVVRILVTSRSGIVDIERELGKSSTKIEIRSSEDDVRTFLRRNLAEQADLSLWIEETPAFEAVIIDAILAKISGMFLLARLYTDIIAHIPTKRGVRKAMEALPDGIEDTYKEAWDRICAQRPHQAVIGKKVLAWVIHSARPIRVSEVIYALAIEDGDEELDVEGFIDPKSLTSFCAGLVIINEESNLLSLVHPTTQEYFNSNKAELLPTAHEEIAMTCMTYLRMRPFSDEGALDDLLAFGKRVSDSPMLGYATVYWGTHVYNAGSERLMAETLAFLKHEKARLSASQALLLNIAGEQKLGTEWPEFSNFGPDDKSFEFQSYQSSQMRISGIHLASFFGLESIVRNFLKSGSNIDEPDGEGGTSIHWALMGEQNEMLRWLLEHGANPNINRCETWFRRWDMAGYFTLPITLAAWMNNVNALRLLLQHGAAINQSQKTTSNKEGDNEWNALSTALYAKALYAEKDEASQFLLEHGADPNLDENGICWPANHGDLEIMKKLLGAGLNEHNMQRAVFAAAESGQLAMLALLLEAGAKADGGPASSSGPPTVNPLVATISNISWLENSAPLECLNLLINAGANVSMICSRTYLYADDFHIGLNVFWSAREDRQTTPLLTAAYFGRCDMIRVLVEKGADLDFGVDQPPFTLPLKAALDREGYECASESEVASSSSVRDTVKLLLELGANPNLCPEVEQARIQQFVTMSDGDYATLDALQYFLRQPRFGEDNHEDSFRERKNQLLRLVDKAAHLRLCGKRDKDRFKQFMDWTEDELDAFDKQRELRAERLDRMIRGPLVN